MNERATVRPETAEDRARCKRCVWQLVASYSSSGKSTPMCGYSLCLMHRSRVAMHYERIGRESLEGFTFGKDCTEYMSGNPRDKISLLGENVMAVTEAAWALLRREFGESFKAKKKEPEKLSVTVDLDVDALMHIKDGGRTWPQIAKASGLTVSNIRSSIKRQRINRTAATRLLDTYGVDVTERTLNTR